MSWISIACSAVCIAVAIVIIFMLAGAVAPRASASMIGQLVLSGIAAVVGLLAGDYVYKRFFPGR
jgi:hypothetical protein